MASSLAQFIAQMEGYGVQGSIAQRNNNPGNLRYDSLQIGQEQTVNGKYATFSDPQIGWNALEGYIQRAAENGDTVRTFIYRYAPPNENDTSNYLNYLVSRLGVGADTPLSQVVGGNNAVSVGNDKIGGGDVSSTNSDLVSDLFDPTQSTEELIIVAGILVGAIVLSKVL